MFETPKANKAGKIIASGGGMNLGATDILGRPLFLFAEDDGLGTGTPPAEDTATAPAEGETAPDAATPEETAPEAWTLPEITADTTDDDIRALYDQLSADVAAAQTLAKESPEQVTAAMVAETTAKHNALATLAETLKARLEERASNVSALNGLDAAPELPTAVSDAPAAPAKAAAVSQPVAPAVSPADAVAGSTGDRPQDGPSAIVNPSDRRALTAAVASTTPRWRSTGDNDAISWAGLIESTRPAHPGEGRTLADVGEIRNMAVMASARADAPSYDDMLTDSPSHNERVINAARERHIDERRGGAVGARMAAICDPPTVLRDAMVIGTDATPFQSSLVQLTATSGNGLKFQYRLPTSIDEATAGVGSWSTTAQGNIDRTNPSTWKPCVAIACPGYDTQTATEITACYEIDAFTELSSPEAEADFVWAKDRAFARYTEGWHLRKTDSFLKYVSLNGYTGAVPTIIEAILTSISSGDYGERLDPGTYTVYGSPGLLYAMVIDEHTKAFRNDAVAALAEVRDIVERATGCTYVQLIDRELASDGSLKESPFGSFGTAGAASPTVMPRLKTAGFTLRILDPSSIVQFTTGEATFGEQITLDQARRNHRGFFQRIFGGQMKPGITPGYKVDVALRTDGSRGGFVNPGTPPIGFDATGGSFVSTPS